MVKEGCAKMVAKFWIGVFPYFGEVATFFRNVTHKLNYNRMRGRREALINCKYSHKVSSFVKKKLILKY
jgi:hypothetical protein